MSIDAEDLKQGVLDWKQEAHPEKSKWHTFENPLSEALYWLDEHLGYGHGTITLPSGVNLYGVDHFGGEDQGSNYWFIVKTDNDEQFFQIAGSYNSWDGVSFDYASIFEVEPFEVTVTQYRRK